LHLDYMRLLKNLFSRSHKRLEEKKTEIQNIDNKWIALNCNPRNDDCTTRHCERSEAIQNSWRASDCHLCEDNGALAGNDAILKFLPRMVMLAPSTSCQAKCKYCFMPYEGQIMNREVFMQAMDFLDRLIPKDKRFTILFHGGEPMLAGLDWFKKALPVIRGKFGHNAELSIQSNIWLLNQDWINLFREYGVRISTSIDGPKAICDSQRGEGYFEKTMQGIRLLKENGLAVSAIATVGKNNISREKCRQLFHFFLDEDIHFSLHGAVPSIERGLTEETLTADEMLQALRHVSEAYFARYQKMTVGTIDQMVKNIYNKKPCLCTFSDCLGTYLAIAPDGYLYTCLRFCGMPELSLGRLSENPTSESIVNSRGYTVFKQLHQTAKEACTKSGCQHFEYCNGGCCYASLAAKKHSRDWDGRDPFCKAYQQFYDELDDKMTVEMGNELLKKGFPAPLLSIAENRRRNFTAVRNSRKILEACQWQKAPGWVQRNKLETIFLNITYNCPFRCKHCWISAEPNRSGEMSVETALKVIDEAFALNFQQVIMTGGEPLFHKEIDSLLQSLSAYRKSHRTPKLTLQTTLALPLTQERITMIKACFSTVNVSIDGNQEQHDERRGKGAYDKAVNNMLELRRTAPEVKIVLTSALSRTEIHGTAGNAVKQLAKELGNLAIEVRELKPMGRHAKIETDEFAFNPDSIYKPFTPRIKCALGNQLHIEPDGSIYPCYVFINHTNYLGNVSGENALAKAVGSAIFAGWKNATVDTNPTCKRCDVRYICGGVCKIKQDCEKEYRYFKKLVEQAKKHIIH